MSTDNWLTLVGFAVTFVAVIVTPLSVTRRAAKQARLQREREESAAALAGDTVTLTTINEAIARERDRLTIALERSDIAHQAAMLELRNTLQAEAARIKQYTDYDLDRANKKIQQLAEEITSLHQRSVANNVEEERP